MTASSNLSYILIVFNFLILEHILILTAIIWSVRHHLHCRISRFLLFHFIPRFMFHLGVILSIWWCIMCYAFKLLFLLILGTFLLTTVNFTIYNSLLGIRIMFSSGSFYLFTFVSVSQLYKNQTLQVDLVQSRYHQPLDKM